MHRLLTTVLGTLCAFAPAHAARNEVSFEASNTIVVDDVLQDFYNVDGLPAPGLRVGVAVLKDRQHFGLVVSSAWHRAQRNTRFDNDDYDYDDQEGPTRAFDTYLTVDTFALGLKADYDIIGIVYPYLRADAELQLLTHRLDDDPDDADNPNQLVTTGLAPAGRFTVGLEVMLPDKKFGWPVTAAVYVEGGYEVAGRAKLADIGSVSLGGGIVTAGLGLRF
jgi:hypothetical protein